ncbi:MAG: hypothetical protein GXY67_08390 [Clostridiales bacterium]|nr:hypothetical protein [Clostridiales bacterium]
MRKTTRWLCLLLCLCLTIGIAALAEAPAADAADPVSVPPTTAAEEYEGSTLVAKLNEREITWADLKVDYENLVNNFSSQYDFSDPSVKAMFQTYVLDSFIRETVIFQQVKTAGLELTAEEKAASDAEADQMWSDAIASYISNEYADLTDESPEEKKAEANAAAEAYFNEMGYSPEILREQMAQSKMYDRLYAQVTQDIVVTDADVEADYQAKVAADKALYENDIAGYINYNSYVDQSAYYAMMTGSSAADMEYAWYKPAGFRAVKHILLPVDEELMSKYKDLQARLEEQMDAEAAKEQGTAEDAAAADATQEPAQNPVTQADVDLAKADILNSLSAKVDEINQKINEGVSFDELIATYGVKADGTTTDPGMTNEPTKTTGYEVAKESVNYVPEFVEAAFSVDNIGDVSAPYLSDYGVHIVKYIGDVAAGPVAMTDAQRQAKMASMLEDRKAEAFSAKLDEWIAASNITYTGVILSYEELEAAYAAEAEEAEEMSVEGLEP